MEELEFGITHMDMKTQERNHYLGSEKYTWYKAIFSKARLTLSCLNEEGALRFQNNVNVTAILTYVTLEAARSWRCLHIRNIKTVLFTDKWMDTCLPTQNDGLVRIMLATLAADIIVTLRYILAINVNLSNQCCEPTPCWRQIKHTY